MCRLRKQRTARSCDAGRGSKSETGAARPGQAPCALPRVAHACLSAGCAWKGLGHSTLGLSHVPHSPACPDFPALPACAPMLHPFHPRLTRHSAFARWRLVFRPQTATWPGRYCCLCCLPVYWSVLHTSSLQPLLHATACGVSFKLSDAVYSLQAEGCCLADTAQGEATRGSRCSAHSACRHG